MKKRFLSFALVCLTLTALTSVCFASSSCSHTYKSQYQAATCSTSGYSRTYCIKCGSQKSYNAYPALGHNYVHQSYTVTPTCTKSGTSYRKCSRSGCSASTSVSVPALGHDWEELERIEDPACTVPGSADMACSRCEATEIQSIPALGHAYAVISHIDPTCTVSGSTVTTCSRCDDTEAETIPALGHDYAVTSHMDPTCTAPGSTVTTCSRCDDAIEETISALGHDYAVTSHTAPTCIDSGSTVTVCSRCDDVKTEEIPVMYHSWEVEEMVPSVYDDEGVVVVEGHTFYSCYSCESQYVAAPGMSPPVSGPIPEGTGMQDTTAALGKTFLSGVWALFSITVPGFGFTFAQMWIGVLLASVSILVIRMIFGFGGGSRGESTRTSSTSNPRISKERRYDQF